MMSDDAGDTFWLDIKCVLGLSFGLFQYGIVGGRSNAAKLTVCTEENAIQCLSPRYLYEFSRLLLSSLKAASLPPFVMPSRIDLPILWCLLLASPMNWTR